jgi:hypothetical protein
LPTALAARGLPAAAATSPYVATRPGGILRTARTTRLANPESFRVACAGIEAYRLSASDRTRPVARSRVTRVNHANVGAMSAGDAAEA